MTKVVKRSLLFVMTVVLALCAFMTVGAMSAKADSTVITPIGASIRLNEGSTGIRFEASISGEQEGVTYGYVIVPEAYLEGIEGGYTQGLINKYSEDGVILLVSIPVDGVIKGSVANIKPKNYGMTFAGIPYKMVDGVYTDGEIMYASILDVATAAKTDVEANYEVDELAVIDEFMSNGLGGADASFAIDTTSKTIEVDGTATIAVETNLPAKYTVWSSDDEDVATVVNGVVTAKSAGTANITAQLAGITATCVVTVNDSRLVAAEKLGKGYVAEFNDDSYLNLVSFSAGTNNVEMATFDDADVLKADISANAVEWVKMTIKLPKAMTIAGKYTVRYYIVANGGEIPNVVRINNVQGALGGDIEYAPAAGTWHEIELTNKATGASGEGYIYDKDPSTFNFQMINTGSALGITIYVDYIYDVTIANQDAIDAMVGKLQPGYVAQFDDEYYANLVSFSAGTHNVEMTTFDDADVLKVDISANALEWVKMTISLPKAMTISGQYKIRYYVVANGGALPNYFRINNVQGAMGGDLEYAPAGGTWEERMLANLPDGGTNYEMYKKNANEFNFQVINTGSALGITIYIDYIYDCTLGSVELAKDLPEGYYAKFDSDAYLYNVNTSCASASIVEFKNEKALKLSVGPTTGWQDVKIALPRALEAGANYTVKYYLDWHYDTDGETKLATPNYFRFNTVLANSTKDHEFNGNAANYFGGDDWREIDLTVHAGHKEANLGTYTFQFIETSNAQYSFDLYVVEIHG